MPYKLVTVECYPCTFKGTKNSTIMHRDFGGVFWIEGVHSEPFLESWRLLLCPSVSQIGVIFPPGDIW